MNNPEFDPVITVRIAKEKVFFGPGVMLILKALKETGSVKEASRLSGISYSKAWKIINMAEEQLGYAIVERQQGGKCGGGCVVTNKGKLLMKQYRVAEKQIQTYAKQVFREIW
ncbi:MAG: LysR family transcriptional regulator [Lachnospiraceae bacterium]